MGAGISACSLRDPYLSPERDPEDGEMDKGTSGTEAACERKNPNCGAKVGGNATPFICDMRPPLFSDKKKLTYRLLSHHMKYCCELFLMFFEIDSSG